MQQLIIDYSEQELTLANVRPVIVGSLQLPALEQFDNHELY